MNTITKTLAIAATVAALGGIGAGVMAQPAGPGYGPMGFEPMGFMHGQGGPGMMSGYGGGPGMMSGYGGAGFADPAARLNALKTELAIRPEQTAAWDAYVKALQDSAAQMLALHNNVDFGALRTMNWQEHQAFMASMFDKRAQVFKGVQTAAATLLAALDDTQKTHALLPSLVDVGPGMMGWQGGPPFMRGAGFEMMPWGPGGGAR